jgi:hypothetical protein
MRCWGITKQLRFCRREATDWWPYCHLHRLQLAYIALSIFGGVVASYLATLLPELHNPLQQSELKAGQPTESADVVFVADRPENPHFWLFNQGKLTAERPKYGFVLYDLDEEDSEQPRKIRCCTNSVDPS